MCLLQADRWRIPEFTQCSQCTQHETENSSVFSWMKQSNTRVSSRSAADSNHWVRQQRKPCHQSSDSFLVRSRHSYSPNAATTVKECQRRMSTGWQCNWERARRTSCAQAGTTSTAFSLWSATNATLAKQEWHGRQALSLEQYVLLHARFSVEGLVSSPANPQALVTLYEIKFIGLNIKHRIRVMPKKMKLRCYSHASRQA